MNQEFSQAELEAYLDEELTATEAAKLEALLREDDELVNRLVAIHGRRDAGVHSLGEIWRRNRITCPDRETLGSYLLAILGPAQQAYIEFHVERVGCRYCQANLDDLRDRQSQSGQLAQDRHQRYFQSSAGYLQRD